jgi:hypothetical protein
MAFLPTASRRNVSAWQLAGLSSTSRVLIGPLVNMIRVTGSRVVDATIRWMVICSMVGRQQSLDLQEQVDGGISRVS